MTAQKKITDFINFQDFDFGPLEQFVKQLLEPQTEAKIGLILCPRSQETTLTGLALESILSRFGSLFITIDCSRFPGRLAHHCVDLTLQNMKLNSVDRNTLKTQEVIILLKGYEQLGSYDNLYVKNRIANWPKAKMICTCRADHFQFRDFQSCFINDPTNPNFSSLKTLFLKSFIQLSSIINLDFTREIHTTNQDDITPEMELVKNLKQQIIQNEVQRFLEKVRKAFISNQTLKADIQLNAQGFISYAWERSKAALSRQQSSLLRIVEDLRLLGFSTWLDIERMTGDIDQQMAGNIKDSAFVLIIGTPNYTERVIKPTNVQKEFEAILSKQKNEANFKIFTLQFADDDDQFKAFPKDLQNGSTLLDFRRVDQDPLNYIHQMFELEHSFGLAPRLLGLDRPEKIRGNETISKSSDRA